MRFGKIAVLHKAPVLGTPRTGETIDFYAGVKIQQ
jgi:hypothetical protein